MLNADQVNFIEYIIGNAPISLRDLSQKYHVNEKQIKYLIEVINEKMSDFIIPFFEINHYKILVSKQNQKKWLCYKEKITIDWLSLQNERVFLIILYTFIRKEEVSNLHYQNFLFVSKNTILLDLKKVRKLCKEFQIEFKYTRLNGYDLYGDEQQIVRLVSYCINEVLKQGLGENLLKQTLESWDSEVTVYQVNDLLREHFQAYQIYFVYDRLKNLVYFLTFLINRKFKKKRQKELYDYTYLKATKVFKITEQLFKEISLNFDEFHLILITQYVLNATYGKNVLNKTLQRKFKVITSSVITEVELNMGVHFSNRRELEQSLYDHLVPSFFRIYYDTPSSLPFLSNIKKDYPDIYVLVGKSLTSLQIALGKEIPEEEVAYFTIHFGGWLEGMNNKEKQILEKKKALVVCPNGISSSLILIHQLKILFPMLYFEKQQTTLKIDEINRQKYDVIFTTHLFPTSQKLYLVKPIMNRLEKEILKKNVMQDLNISSTDSIMNIDRIMSIVRNYTEIVDENKLREKLIAEIYCSNMIEEQRSGEELTSLLQENFIQVTNQKMNWKEAIGLAAEPLLKKDMIMPSYVEAMIQVVEKMGAYIVLAPHVAVPHARPEDGVRELGMSLLKLDYPVDFNINKNERDEDLEVQLIFVLAAMDNTSHLTALKQLSEILDDDDKITEMIHSMSAKELFEIIKNYIERSEKLA